MKITVALIDDYEENQTQSLSNIKHAIESISEFPHEVEFKNIPLKEKNELIEKITGILSDSSKLDTAPNSLRSLEGVDVLFLDYQLPKLDGHAWLTAEDLAGAFRAFSQIPVVCILNRFHEVDFDLSLLAPTVTAADLHLNAESLVCGTLWVKPESRKLPIDMNRENFRPWYWPSLPELIDDIHQCRKDLMGIELKDTKVFDFLNFNEDDFRALTKTALGFINPQSPEPQNATFLDFFMHGCNGCITEEIKTWVLTNPEEIERKKIATSVIVAQMKRWLTHMVMASGDAVADIPHLISRMYWIQQGDVSINDTWLRAGSFTNEKILHDALEEFTFKKRHWLSRDGYWTQRIEASDKLDKLYQIDVEIDELNLPVYLEDFSIFVTREETDEFSSALNSIWSNRYISRTAFKAREIKYAPKVRLI
ncbi:hypothetical protein EMIT093MI4_60084 [Pseudomonas sp. IT-93MI4]|uniref:hypothetical protein n=1 Tax=unclassified Pseudomonas TaxID=196821 RepID=UPI002556EEF4|nr:hypothetical protein [Pseudomonas sp. lyk4-TYG-107]